MGSLSQVLVHSQPNSRIREFAKFLPFLKIAVIKEFKSRYSQSILGTLWLVLEPLIVVATFSIIFTLLGRKGPNGMPFPVFFYSGVLTWNLFSLGLTKGTTVFVSDKSLIQKINYPKEISLIKAITIYIIDFLFACLAFVFVLALYRIPPNFNYIFIPLLLGLQLLLSFGLMMFFSTIHVFVRDVGILTKSLATVWFWFTPVIFQYPFEGQTKIIYYLNPMAGIINSYHQIIIYKATPQLEELVCAFIAIPISLLAGYFIFRAKERDFADVL